MHILHVIDSLGLGGAERMVVDLANAAAADGHAVSVCVTRADTTLASDLVPEVALLVLARKSRFELSSSRTLARWIRDRDVDVLHVHMRHTLAFVLLLRILGFVNRPIVFHDHYGTIEVDTATPLWFRVGHRLIAHYVGVYDALSAWARSAGMPSERTTTIENAIDLRRLSSEHRHSLRAELGVPAQSLLGLMVATVRPDKSIETLINGMARANLTTPTQIAIAGAFTDSEYAGRCRALVRSTGSSGAIQFLGPRTDIPAILPGCDFAVLSSHTESGPLVLIEYLAAGLPVVATAVGEIGKRLQLLGLPGMVGPNDTHAFATALEELVSLSPSQRRVRGDLGRQLLGTTWDIRASMDRWYRVYETAVRRAS